MAKESKKGVKEGVLLKRQYERGGVKMLQQVPEEIILRRRIFVKKQGGEEGHPESTGKKKGEGQNLTGGGSPKGNKESSLKTEEKNREKVLFS